MNLIKFKDIINPEDKIFNQKLKGKYAYWIHMKYVVPLEDMGVEGYIACEKDINNLLINNSGEYPKPYGVNYWDVIEVSNYVDVVETDRINCINTYKVRNSFTTDSNITLDEIKKFRTWLASTLLSFDKTNSGEYVNYIYDEYQIHILEYYENEMYNNVIKYLGEFSGDTLQYNNIITSSCACHSSSALSNLSSISICDPVTIYRKNIYLKMVEIFSDINFWINYPKEFILEFKTYIDSIINCNLPLTKSEYISEFIDCECETSDIQSQMISILKRLSTSLKYIYDDDIIGHKNFINDSLKSWSSDLYEAMRW